MDLELGRFKKSTYKDKECPSESYTFLTRKLFFFCTIGYRVYVNNELISKVVFNAVEVWLMV